MYNGNHYYLDWAGMLLSELALGQTASVVSVRSRCCGIGHGLCNFRRWRRCRSTSLVTTDRGTVEYSNCLIIIGLVHLRATMFINAGRDKARNQLLEASVYFCRLFICLGVLGFIHYLPDC